jgi:sodium ion-translocating decarboxylase beta subunit
MPGGILYYFFNYGVATEIFPPLIFLGIGAMTDFGPMLANPKTILLGGAAQVGIYIALLMAQLLGFNIREAASIGIIGGADGPTAIYTAIKLAPQLLGAIAVAAYTYMSLVPLIQKPIVRALTTHRERCIVMKQLREVSQTERIIFPIAVTIAVGLLLPPVAPLVGMLMLGNLFRETHLLERLARTAQNELINIVTILLSTSVGATMSADSFLTANTLKIVALGLVAFAGGTAGGVLMAKLMNWLAGGNEINPIIGGAGVSAVPMAARVAQVIGQEEEPGNFLLMHAMGPNVAGVIGTAIAAGTMLALLH